MCVFVTNIPIKAEVEWPKLKLEVTFICEMTRKKNYHEQQECDVWVGYIKTAVVCGDVTSFLMM